LNAPGNPLALAALPVNVTPMFSPETRYGTAPRAFAAACACLLAASSSVMADEVRLLNGGKLSGNVLSIQEGGAIRFDSPLSAEPLALNGDAVEQVEFQRAGATPTTGNTRFELINQDFLIGTLLGYSQETGARIEADGIGELNIPVGSLRYISLDVQPSQIIYQGPDDLANWTVSERGGAENWGFGRERLSVTGAGQIGRMLELPDRYVIRTKIRWQGQPNFQLSFSDPLEEPQVRVDRYYLQFGRAGLEIKRETSSGKRYHTVGTLNRTPDQYPNREMDIELRVDHSQSIIYLAINGNQEGRFMDPFGVPPTAGGISLVSNASAGNTLEITGLLVESWHERATKLPARKRDAASNHDSLMMREGDHFGGTIHEIRKVGEDLMFSMKVDFREQPLEIHGDDVSIVSFATEQTEDDDSDAAPAPDFVLKLNERGRLGVTRSSFDAGQVRATHPLLGDLTISRDSVSSLERRNSEKISAAQP